MIDGTTDLNKLLQGKMTSILFRQKRKAAIPSRIHFDDDFSDRCTILEIVTQDAFGLLYRIGTALSTHGCNIEVALITTEGHRAIDVFYLTRAGAKLSGDIEKAIETDMLEVVGFES